MEDDIKSFLSHLAKEKDYSSNTLSAYQSDLSQLVAFVKSYEKQNPGNASKLNTEVLAGYLRDLKEKKYSQATVARKVAAAKSFLKYLVDAGKLRGDLTPNLSSPQVNKSSPKPLSVSDVRRFLAEPGKSPSVEAKRDKAMLELLYATGLRASELMGLNVGDINLGQKNVVCRGSKSNVRMVPIDGHIAHIIEEYIVDVRPRLLNDDSETALFLNRRGERLTRQGFWQIIQGYAEKVDLDGKVTPRSLRHSFAAHKLSSGADLESVQILLGHTHISTTRVYKDKRD